MPEPETEQSHAGASLIRNGVPVGACRKVFGFPFLCASAFFFCRHFPLSLLTFTHNTSPFIFNLSSPPTQTHQHSFYPFNPTTLTFSNPLPRSQSLLSKHHVMAYSNGYSGGYGGGGGRGGGGYSNGGANGYDNYGSRSYGYQDDYSHG